MNLALASVIVRQTAVLNQPQNFYICVNFVWYVQPERKLEKFFDD